MLIFQNDGLIAEDTITTMGVSAKVNDNPIGVFGTGLKFALAIILRGGGSVRIWRGKKLMVFGRSDKTIRGKDFKIINMNGKKMGFTDQLGLNWQPWMAYRELYSNCKDEGGSIRQIVPTGDSTEELGEPKKTKIIVEWPELERIHENRNSIILTTEAMYTLAGVEVHPPVDSGHVYYKRIRVMDLNPPSKFTYSLTGNKMLTEDRTLMYPTLVPVDLVRAIITCTNKDFLNAVLDSDIVGKSYEGKLNYEYVKETKPSVEFLEVAERKMAAKRLVSGAHGLFKHFQDTLPGYVSPYIVAEFSQTQLDIIDAALAMVQAKFPDFNRSQFYFKTQQVHRTTVADGKIVVKAELIAEGKTILARALVEGIASLQKGGMTEQLANYVLTGHWIPEELVQGFNSRADNFEPADIPF